MLSGARSAKSTTRSVIRARRATRDPAARRLVEQALVRYLEPALDAAAARAALPGAASSLVSAPAEGPGRVAAYGSLPGEPGTGVLRQELRLLGHPVLLPVLLDDLDLDWAEDPGPTGHGSALRPPGERLGRDAVAACVLVLVPALAVDTTGTRLGQGGGSYDRALARVASSGRRPLVLAVVHDDEVLSEPLPRDPHDVGVDGALTPSGLLLLR